MWKRQLKLAATTVRLWVSMHDGESFRHGSSTLRNPDQFIPQGIVLISTPAWASHSEAAVAAARRTRPFGNITVVKGGTLPTYLGR